jgi:hypothetical protein
MEPIMTASMPPPRAASVSDLLQTAVRLFRATLPKCLPFAMVAVLLAQLPAIYWIATGHQVSLKVPEDATYEALSLLGLIFEIWLMASMMLRQRAIISAAPVHAVAELNAALQRLPVLLLTFLLGLLSVAAGPLLAITLLPGILKFIAATLLMVPGIFLLVCYTVALPVALFEPVGPYSALVRSVQLIRPVWWKTLAALVIASLAMVVCLVAFAAVIGIVALLVQQGPAFTAIQTASFVGLFAVVFVFFSALALVLHSAASNSA